MKKIQKCQGGATLIQYAPYSYSAPALGTAVGSLTKGLTSAIPAVAPYAGAAVPLLSVPAAMGAGFYVLGNPQHDGVSGAIQAAAERERARHLAQAEKQWQEKNQYYADLLSTHGPIKYPVGTFYDYDQSTGTAYLEKDLGNGLIGRWTQNMRTREQGNPRAYNPITGEVYEGTFTGPHTATIPITLSNGQVVSLPTDITDYRVFDEAAVETKNPDGTRTSTETGTASTGDTPPKKDDDDDKDNQISSVEEYVKKFGKNMNWRTARRIRNSERISHDATGKINYNATRMLNRGVNAGAEGAKTGGFPWQTFLFGTSLGGGLTLGGQAIFGNKKEAEDPGLHGETVYTERTGNAIDKVLQDDAESVPIQRDSTNDWEAYFFPKE